jgi:hypothetical protein
MFFFYLWTAEGGSDLSPGSFYSRVMDAVERLDGSSAELGWEEKAEDPSGDVSEELSIAN